MLLLAQLFKDLDRKETEAYQYFNKILNSRNRKKTLGDNPESYKRKLRKAYKTIQLLEEERISRMEEYFKLADWQREIFWEDYSGSKANHKTYHDFISKIPAIIDPKIDSKINANIVMQLKSDTFKLASYERGEHLLSKVCERSKTQNLNLDFMISDDYAANISPADANVFAEQSEPSEIKVKADIHKSLDPLKSLDSLKSRYADNNNKKSFNVDTDIALSRITIANPKKRHLYIYVGIEKDSQALLSISPSYRALYHELTHINRALNRTQKRNFIITPKYSAAYSRSAEELWAINLGKNSEAALSKEDGLPVRITHNSSSLYLEGDQIVEAAEDSKTENKYTYYHDKIEQSLRNGEAILGRTNYQGHSHALGDYHLLLNLNEVQGAINLKEANYKVFMEGNISSKSNFEKSTLISGSHLSDCTLAESNFKRSSCHQIKITETNLRKSNFSRASIIGSEFSKCNLEKINFNHTDLSNVKFNECILKGANFENANLSNVFFTNIDLTKIKFKNANLDTVIFVNCTISKAKLLEILDTAINRRSSLFLTSYTAKKEALSELRKMINDAPVDTLFDSVLSNWKNITHVYTDNHSKTVEVTNAKLITIHRNKFFSSSPSQSTDSQKLIEALEKSFKGSRLKP